MVLLIQTPGRIVKQRDWHLHSSIVLLIPDIDDYEQSEIMNLHSSIVLLIHNTC